MTKFGTITEILEFAISREQEAVDFYTEMASKADSKHMNQLFLEFAKEEEGHKAKLMGLKSEESTITPAFQKVQDLKIADYTVDVTPDTAKTYQDSLLLAMKKEKAAYKLYNDLANATDDPKYKNLFLMLAQEEAKHKLRFEVEYDDNVLKEN